MLKALYSFALLSWVVSASLPLAAISQSAKADTLVPVVEYYNADRRHYFITANPQEAAILDAGTVLRGWTRTGYEFMAAATGSTDAGLRPVCRFYGRPEAGLDSHFYSGSPDECWQVIQKFARSWLYESSNVFQIQMPDLGTGICAAGAVPVYRLFNNRTDANHRYTTDAGVRATMISSGYAPEGYGPSGVAFCAAPAAAGPSASILVTTVAPDTFSFSAASNATLISYAWDFGDGATAIDANALHRYAASGTYTVSLTARDDKGASICRRSRFRR